MLRTLARCSRLLVLVLVIFSVIISTFSTITPTYAQQPNHTVQPGENLFRIALQYGLTAEQLAAANGITDPTKIFVGQVLVIPVNAPPPAPDQNQQPPAQPQPDQQQQQAVPPASVDPSTGKYAVQVGDTMSIISRKFGVSYADLLASNSLVDPNHIIPGQQIVIPGVTPNNPAPPPAQPQPEQQQPQPVQPTNPPPPAPADNTAASTVPATYVVQPGEGLAAIGRKFNIPWPDIAGANNIMDPNTIYAGMVLRLPQPGSGVPTMMENSAGVPPGPAPTVAGKFIKVVLHEQRVYAFENGTLVHTTIGSTGLPGTPTVQGNFKIYVKYAAQLMTGPGYYLPGVPWVMYFYEGYSLHGTYWHSNWGHPMSHGCVNLPTEEAKWYYDWAEVGTPVTVVW
jgi:LysM repeat protein